MVALWVRSLNEGENLKSWKNKELPKTLIFVFQNRSRIGERIPCEFLREALNLFQSPFQISLSPSRCLPPRPPPPNEARHAPPTLVFESFLFSFLWWFVVFWVLGGFDRFRGLEWGGVPQSEQQSLPCKCHEAGEAVGWCCSFMIHLLLISALILLYVGCRVTEMMMGCTWRVTPTSSSWFMSLSHKWSNCIRFWSMVLKMKVTPNFSFFFNYCY